MDHNEAIKILAESEVDAWWWKGKVVGMRKYSQGEPGGGRTIFTDFWLKYKDGSEERFNFTRDLSLRNGQMVTIISVAHEKSDTGGPVATIINHASKQWYFFDSAESIIESLHKEYKIGIISDIQDAKAARVAIFFAVSFVWVFLVFVASNMYNKEIALAYFLTPVVAAFGCSFNNIENSHERRQKLIESIEYCIDPEQNPEIDV